MVGSCPKEDERKQSKKGEEKIPNGMQRLTFSTDVAHIANIRCITQYNVSKSLNAHPL
jgi:hypothetical protein